MKTISVHLTGPQQKRLEQAARKARGQIVKITKRMIGGSANSRILCTDSDAAKFQKAKAKGCGCCIEALPFGGSGMAGGLLPAVAGGVATAAIVDRDFRKDALRAAKKSGKKIKKFFGFGMEEPGSGSGLFLPGSGPSSGSGLFLPGSGPSSGSGSWQERALMGPGRRVAKGRGKKKVHRADPDEEYEGSGAPWLLWDQVA